MSKKVFKLYTAPAVFAYEYACKNVPLVNTVKDELEQYQAEVSQLKDYFSNQVAMNMGIAPEKMTKEERLSTAKSALRRAESNLSAALVDALKAWVLLSFQEKNLEENTVRRQYVVEGEYQRIH